ncbi:MAG TPA: MFS transporter [Polyangia bacterium]|nr:MFS transporter [Polyangia bacterium]
MVWNARMLGLPFVYWVLWTGALINRLGGFVYTFLALYLTQERGFSVEQAGGVVSLYGLGSIVASAMGGVMADRLGRRPTLLLASVFGAAAMLQLGLARAPWHIAVATFLLGLLTDAYRPALQASVADVAAPEDRIRAYGYLYWAANLGFTGAAVIGGLLAKAHFALLFAGDAATTLLFGLLVFLRVPETRPDSAGPAASASERAEPSRPPAPPASLDAPYRDPILVAFLLAQLLVAVLFFQSAVTLPVDMRAHGRTEAQYGGLIAINGVLIVTLQPLVTRLVQRYPRAQVLALGAALTGVGFGLTGLGHSALFYAFTIVVWTLGEMALSPVAPAVVADLSPRELRGMYQGAFTMTWGIAAALAPVLGSMALGRGGSWILWGGCAALGLLAAGLHLLIAPARRRRLMALATAEDDPVAREDGLGRW